MRIGRLRARLRASTKKSAKPEYYCHYTYFKAFGDYLIAQICPFDGKAFLHWYWRRQDNKVWYGRSVDGLIPAALIDYTTAIRSEWIKETKKSKEDWSYLTLLPYPYDDIIVNCTFSLEGKWICNYELITVLKTTRMKVEFRAETREVLLPPGAIVRLTPLPLMQKLGENISIEEIERHLPTRVRKIFASAKTPQELAARLELEPIKLREELEDRGEVERRIFSCK